jgi:hypothetical protein
LNLKCLFFLTYYFSNDIFSLEDVCYNDQPNNGGVVNDTC